MEQKRNEENSYRVVFDKYSPTTKILNLDVHVDGSVTDYIFYPMFNVSQEINIGGTIQHLNAIFIVLSKEFDDDGDEVGTVTPKFIKKLDLNKLSDSDQGEESFDFNDDRIFIILFHDNTFKIEDVGTVYTYMQEYWDEANENGGFCYREISPNHAIPRKAGMTIISKG